MPESSVPKLPGSVGLRIILEILFSGAGQWTVSEYFPSALSSLWFVVLLLATIELLNTNWARKATLYAYQKWARRQRMLSYAAIFVIGGLLLSLYWWGTGKAVAALDERKKQQAKSPNQTNPEPPKEPLSFVQESERVSLERARVKLEDDFTVSGLAEIAAGKPQDIELRYKMTNYGKTEARVIGRTFKVLLANEFFLPLVPEYGEPISFTEGIENLGADKSFQSEPFIVPVSRPGSSQHKRITKKEAVAVLSPCKWRKGIYDPECRKYLFVYGFIEFKDVLGKRHKSGFAYLYYFKAGKPGRPFRVGTPAYWVDE